ncbi:inactive C-alpha-formylglycine-generating enzyme 2-like [Lineus longissimus]|uniref:inactive C-alpha-formylglycine-generating enzyme 2-like n=1 Tax=Lineus longissimus TaxID=88925 RepID=UPI002B4E4BE4
MAPTTHILGLAVLCLFCFMVCFGMRPSEWSNLPDSKIIWKAAKPLLTREQHMEHEDEWTKGHPDDPYDGMAKFFGQDKIKIGINDIDYKEHGEFPYRVVKLDDFMMDKYPVTVGQFRRFQQNKPLFRSTAEMHGFSHVFFRHVTNPIQYPEKDMKDVFWRKVPLTTWAMPWGRKDTDEDTLNEDLPAVHVSHDDASNYCNWRGKRLPSEAEWEYAARAGNPEPIIYPWGDHFKPKRMNHWQGYYPGENLEHDGHGGVAPVDAFEAQNTKGMHDMVGNIWEWTASFYIPYDRTNYTMADVGKTFVTKGGSFIDTVEGNMNHPIRVASRWPQGISYTAENVGFRCARSWDVDVSWMKAIKPDKPKPQHIRFEDTWEFKKNEKLRLEKMEKLKNIGERKKAHKIFRKDEL